MGRIRTIKPDFFMHEELAELTPLHRLLFIGLWTQADREGRLADRPRRIKAALLPWDESDIDALLADLDRADFIQRYETKAGARCIEIRGFKRHQRPHPRESAIGIPDPPSREKVLPGREKVSMHPGENRVAVRGEGKEILDKGKEISFPAPKIGAGPAGAGQTTSIDELQSLWNDIATPIGLPGWRETSRPRRIAATARLRERPDLAQWRQIILAIAKSDFCRGGGPSGWKAGPEFLLRPGTGSRMLEGDLQGKAKDAGPINTTEAEWDGWNPKINEDGDLAI